MAPLNPVAPFEPIVLRWKSGIHTSRLEPYIELAGGGLHTNTNFPSGNTSDFNVHRFMLPCENLNSSANSSREVGFGAAILTFLTRTRTCGIFCNPS
jgi:hypothetical protein